MSDNAEDMSPFNEEEERGEELVLTAEEEAISDAALDRVWKQIDAERAAAEEAGLLARDK
jgi:hypothetical protein